MDLDPLLPYTYADLGVMVAEDGDVDGAMQLFKEVCVVVVQTPLVLQV